MAALTEGRPTPILKTKAPNRSRSFPIAAGVKCISGGIACLNASGYVQPGTTATGLKTVGVFSETVDNTDGSNGDLRAEVEDCGAYGFDSGTSGDLIDFADIGAVAYVIDDQTVGLTNGGSTRSEAGRIYDVKDGQVFIEFED
ncbi:MAG: hypothetical protein JJ863_21410 [Deltaproteobacteria bacterium]|nr:hypothetical protein [Deltaproteobacteria bacterium]